MYGGWCASFPFESSAHFYYQENLQDVQTKKNPITTKSWGGVTPHACSVHS